MIIPDSIVMTSEQNDTHSRRRYEVVTLVSYLLGVPKKYFVLTGDGPSLGTYDDLDKEKHARILRNLSIIRTQLERNYKAITQAITFEKRSLLSVDALLSGAITGLSDDGVSFLKSRSTTNDYIIQCNKLISDRVNNCKSLFPAWLNWTYVRSIFIMPNGLTEDGIKKEAEIYYANKDFYPFQMYLNWPPADHGNILNSDIKFVSMLYQWNNDEFTDISKVSDASNATKGDIYDFLEGSRKAVMVVDCENSDPYKLCATLQNIPGDSIDKILLFSDVHAATAWEILEKYTDAKVEYNLIERIKENKSLVDIKLTAESCGEFYKNQVDSFIIVSSDSDYWGLITSLPDARFLVMIESRKCGPDMKAAMEEASITYCYLDDFYSGNNEILIAALVSEVKKYLANNVSLNVNDMMASVYQSTRADLSEAEKKSFFERFIKPMHLVIEPDGNVKIELKK